jgi:hypothetical protein
VLLAKLGAITDASATNPYLLKIEPGVYELRFPVFLKAHVDVEGSGEAVTAIRNADGVSLSPLVFAQKLGAAPLEVRSLTIENRNPAVQLTSAFVSHDSSPRLLNVTLVSESAGESRPLSLSHSSTLLRNVTIRGSAASGIAAGVSALGHTLEMYDVDVHVTAPQGTVSPALDMVASGTVTTVRGGRLRGRPAVFIGNSTLRAGATLVDGDVMQLGGTVTCVGSFDADFTSLGSDCR